MLNYFKCFSGELKIILLPHSVNQGKFPLKLLGLTFHLLESLMPKQSGIKPLLSKDGSALIICCSTPDSVSYVRVKTQWMVNFEPKKCDALEKLGPRLWVGWQNWSVYLYKERKGDQFSPMSIVFHVDLSGPASLGTVAIPLLFIAVPSGLE